MLKPQFGMKHARISVIVMTTTPKSTVRRDILMIYLEIFHGKPNSCKSLLIVMQIVELVHGVPRHVINGKIEQEKIDQPGKLKKNY